MYSYKYVYMYKYTHVRSLKTISVSHYNTVNTV